MQTEKPTPKELNAAKIIDGYARKDERTSPAAEDIKEKFESHVERSQYGYDMFADFETGLGKADKENMVSTTTFGGKKRIQPLD